LQKADLFCFLPCKKDFALQHEKKHFFNLAAKNKKGRPLKCSSPEAALTFK
jgi:hypothetical protein